MGQPVSAGSAYGLRPTLAWPVTWPAPLKSRYVTWGALQVLYAFAFAAYQYKRMSQTERDHEQAVAVCAKFWQVIQETKKCPAQKIDTNA